MRVDIYPCFPTKIRGRVYCGGTKSLCQNKKLPSPRKRQLHWHRYKKRSPFSTATVEYRREQLSSPGPGTSIFRFFPRTEMQLRDPNTQATNLPLAVGRGSRHATSVYHLWTAFIPLAAHRWPAGGCH